MVFSVARKGGPFEGQDIPAEVTIKRFANENLTDVPEAFPSDKESLNPPPATPEVDQAKKVTPGSWFDDATELTADNISSVTADIVPGETHVYKIKSEYGQQLRGAVKLIDAPEADKLAQISGLDIKTLNSARQLAGSEENRPVNEHQIGEETAFGNSARINYRNRIGEDGEKSGDYEAERAWLDGDQYIVVFFNNSWGAGKSHDVADVQNVPVTYQLTTELVGEKIPGPSFEKVAHKSPSSETPTSSQQEPKDTAENEDDGSSNMMWISIGGVLLAVFVGAAIALTRK